MLRDESPVRYDGRSRAQPVSRRAALRTITGGALLLGGCGGTGAKRSPASSPASVPAVADATLPPTQEPIASPVPGYLDPQRWVGRTLTVASWGGAYQQAQEESFFAPFALATGAKVLQKTSDLSRLKNQVTNEAVSWDVVDVPTEQVLPLSNASFLAPIDYKVVDKTPLSPEVVMQYGVGVGYFSTVIAYAAGHRVPQGWTDFWDTGALVGGRALWRGPVGTMEFALLADGQPIDSLYPLDIERAFESLDRIRPRVSAWYQNNLQPVELIANGQVALASAWNVRADLPALRGLVALQWNGGMLSADSWVIPHGAANADVAMDFLNFATRAIPSANFSRLVPYGPVNKDAFVYLTPERVEQLPNAESHRAVQFVQNWNWWADNEEALTMRFDEWLLRHAPEATPGAAESRGPAAG